MAKVASGSPPLGGRSAGFLAKVAKVLSRFSQVGFPLLVARLLDSRLRLPSFFKVLLSGSPSLGGTSAGFLAKVAEVLPRFSQVVLPLLVAGLLVSWLRLPRFSQGSPKWFSRSWWQLCWIHG